MSKLLKRLILCLLCVLMIPNGVVLAYSPGAREYSFDFSNLSEYNNAVVSSSGVELQADGFAKFDLVLPFTASELVIEYTAEKDTTLTINTIRNTYSVELPAKENVANVALMNDRTGEQKLELYANAPIYISSVKYNKVDVEYPPSNVTALELTEFESKMFTAVAISEGAVALYDKGALRYLDYNNSRLTPKYFNGSLYIPAFSLARALDMYIEDYPEKNYLLLRTEEEDIEIFIENDNCHVRQNSVKFEIENPVVYDNGTTWLPVRRISELVGKTVGYRDGIVIIDYKSNVSDILSDSQIFSNLKTVFSKYYLEDNKRGKTYHVSKSSLANDNGEGTLQNPFKTIQKAAEVAKAGDKVIIHEGIYNETVKPKNNGTASNPIIFESADGEEVVVSTATDLSGFLKYKDNIYCIEVPENVGKYRMQVFCNGKNLTEGRHPNEHNQPDAVEYFDSVNQDLFATHGDIFIRTHFNHATIAGMSGRMKAESYSGSLDQEEPDYWKGASFVSLKGEGWGLSTALVKNSGKGYVILDEINRAAIHSIIYYPSATEYDWGYLTNHINCVDKPGEWYFDGKTLFIIPPEGTAGEDLVVSVKQGFTTFDLSDKKFIQLKNINTRYGSITTKGKSEHIVINGGKHEYITAATFVAPGENQGYIDTAESPLDTLENGGNGMYITGDNHAIINAKISGSATNAMIVKGRYHMFYNTEIENVGYMQGVGMQIGSDTDEIGGGHQIINCSIHATGKANFTMSHRRTNSSGEYAGAAYPFEVAYNEFYDATQYTRDAGIVYMNYSHNGHDMEFSKLHHNIIHDSAVTNKQTGSINSIYFDNMCSGIVAHNNITYWTRAEHEFTSLFVQKKSTFPDSWSKIPNYSNKNLALLENGFDKTAYSSYASGKPFFAGVYEEERFMENYNKYSEEYGSLYSEDAVLTDSAEITKDGFVAFNKTGKIIFKDIDISDTNQIVGYFAAESRIKDYNVKVQIKKNGEILESLPLPIICTSDNLNSFIETKARYSPIEGKVDIELSVYDTESDSDELRFIRVKIDYTDEEPPAPVGSTVVFGGDFDDHIKNTMEQMGPFSNYNISRYSDYSHSYASYIFENTLIYKNIELTKDYTDFLLYAMRWAGETGYSMQVRIGSPTAKPIVEMDLSFDIPILGGREVKGWYYKKESFKLEEPLKAGVYDFYITFKDNSGSKDSCDLQYFAFYNESEQ